jgi:hypothetical protein
MDVFEASEIWLAGNVLQWRGNRKSGGVSVSRDLFFCVTCQRRSRDRRGPLCHMSKCRRRGHTGAVPL